MNTCVNLIGMYIYIIYIFVHVSVYVFMCRHVSVYERDCFMYVHKCTLAFVCML